ncbi:MAG: methyl-accepting chemotaxis protein [Myxococcales bacterium]
MSWLHRAKLRNIIFGSFSLLLAVLLITTAWFVTSRVKDSLRASLNARGADLARSLAERSALPFQSELQGAEAMRSVQLSSSEGHVILVKSDFSITATSGVDPALSEAALARLRALVDESRKRGRTFERTDEPADLGTGHILYAQAARERRIDQLGASDERVVGYAVVLLSDRQVTAVLGSVLSTMVVVFVVGVIVFFVVLAFISRQFITAPLESMMGVAKKISDCDLTEQVKGIGGVEFGQLSDALNRTGENLRTTLSRVKGVSESVATVIEKISHTGDVVAKGAATTAQSVDETSSSMEEMIASLKSIAENVEVLAGSAEESSTSIMEMAATNNEVAENIQGLSASVEETTAAIGQMTFSIREVAANIEELSSSSGETSSSMNEMDVSIGQVETNANETARLSETVSEDANFGVLTLQKTLVGIDKIKESSKQAAEVIESLGKKIGTIGNILNVIDDVAEQTNLLALNAAIIAAQAGEHGKGFAVVADEIKDLAERTGASTKEISALIKGVQDESKNAIEAMERGVKAVDDGVRLGGDTSGALKKISDSSAKATQMVKAIARATVEQARGSKQVTNAINRIDQTVQQIAKSTAELAKGSEQIMKSAEKMKSITKHVERSSQEQARGSKQITHSIENINEMVTHLNNAQKEQTKGSEQVMRAVESIKGVADQQNLSMKELERAIDTLAQQAEVLRDEVRRFKV